METTRHHTSTVYVVNDGATLLHRHPKLGIRIPPGGHLERDELPHECGLREVREETGLDPTLVDDTASVGAPAGETLPAPRHTMLYDIDTNDDGEAYHQHVDHVFFAHASDRAVSPAPGEEPAEAWTWYTPEELRGASIAADTVSIGIEAVDTVHDWS